MKQVSSSTLKAKLASYLRAVKRGDEVVILEHSRPIAKLVRIEAGAPGAELAYLEHLEREGVLSIGRGKPEPKLVADKLVSKRSVLGALRAERDDGDR
jgi:prevent-host-death family protein